MIELKEIIEHAERIKNDEMADARGMEPGEAWAQGDVLIMMLESVPDGAEEIEVNAKLVPGTSQGSQHKLVSIEGVKMYRFGTRETDGPVFVLPRDNTVGHPEHGDVLLGPGVFRCSYQREYGDELRRRRD